MWRRKSKEGLLAVVILVVSLVFILSRSDLFVIRKIDLETKNVSCVDENHLKSASGLIGQKIFLVDSAKIADSLKKEFFCIKSIILSKYFPDKVRLQVFGRQPLARLVTLKEKQASSSSLIETIATPEASLIQDLYIVDEEGIVFSKNMDELNVPKVYIYGKRISLGEKIEDSLTMSSLEILDKIKTYGVAVKESWISDDFLIINPDVSGPKIIFRLNEKIDIQLASLQLILAKAKIDLKELEFIDLRFDKPVIQFAPKKIVYGERQNYLRNRCWLIQNSHPDRFG